MTEMAHPRAMAPQLEKLVEEKEQADREAAALLEELGGNQVMRILSEEDARAFLINLGETLNGGPGAREGAPACAAQQNRG